MSQLIRQNISIEIDYLYCDLKVEFYSTLFLHCNSCLVLWLNCQELVSTRVVQIMN